MAKDIKQTSINTIRTLAMDAVQAANSGHPGTPMALAPVTYQLWTEQLRYDPAAPAWMNRDRYVLSCGHASMLLYSMIHLAGIRETDASGRPTGEPALTLDQLKNFRQWGSLTPGHPEYGHTTGVETTTGPLGQGCGNSVGMAIAGRWMAARYNRPGFELFDFNVWVQCSDGDLMEGVACEAASLAGHLKLPNLCWIYDDNNITIEGEAGLAFSEDVSARFRALGWNVVEVADANDLAALSSAYRAFLDHDAGPTLIRVKSVIAYGAPNAANTSEAHGAPLGDEEIALAKKAYGWPAEKFLVPAEVPAHFQDTMGRRGGAARERWDAQFKAYSREFPELAAEIEAIRTRELPNGWDAELPKFPADPKGLATRASSAKALNALAKNLPWLLGGSADLAPSTKTLLSGDQTGHFGPTSHGGRNFHFGIREHAMAAAVNGMALCGLRPYGATFFVFTDYMRPSLRLAAIMNLPSIFVMTHDSIGVGEDGPTHQPVEHLAACRAIPGVIVLRPADANETAEAWRFAVAESQRPSVLVLTRQNLPTFARGASAEGGVARGGYILADAPGGTPQVVLLSTGSEVYLALAAHEKLVASGISSRVVSLPSFELFDAQPDSYKEAVLPSSVTARVAIEAGIRQGWDKYLGARGTFIGLDTYGASAPYAEIYERRGLTAQAVEQAARRLLT